MTVVEYTQVFGLVLKKKSDFQVSTVVEYMRHLPTIPIACLYDNMNIEIVYNSIYKALDWKVAAWVWQVEVSSF
jgi:hypothetical protein